MVLLDVQFLLKHPVFQPSDEEETGDSFRRLSDPKQHDEDDLEDDELMMILGERGRHFQEYRRAIEITLLAVHTIAKTGENIFFKGIESHSCPWSSFISCVNSSDREDDP